MSWEHDSARVLDSNYGWADVFGGGQRRNAAQPFLRFQCLKLFRYLVLK